MSDFIREYSEKGTPLPPLFMLFSYYAATNGEVRGRSRDAENAQRNFIHAFMDHLYEPLTFESLDTKSRRKRAGFRLKTISRMDTPINPYIAEWYLKHPGKINKTIRKKLLESSGHLAENIKRNPEIRNAFAPSKMMLFAPSVDMGHNVSMNTQIAWLGDLFVAGINHVDDLEETEVLEKGIEDFLASLSNKKISKSQEQQLIGVVTGRLLTIAFESIEDYKEEHVFRAVSTMMSKIESVTATNPEDRLQNWFYGVIANEADLHMEIISRYGEGSEKGAEQHNDTQSPSYNKYDRWKKLIGDLVLNYPRAFVSVDQQVAMQPEMKKLLEDENYITEETKRRLAITAIEGVLDSLGESDSKILFFASNLRDSNSFGEETPPDDENTVRQKFATLSENLKNTIDMLFRYASQSKGSDTRELTRTFLIFLSERFPRLITSIETSLGNDYDERNREQEKWAVSDKDMRWIDMMAENKIGTRLRDIVCIPSE